MRGEEKEEGAKERERGRERGKRGRGREGGSKLPLMGGFMPSSRLVLRQWLVYAAHDSEDFASEPSSLESLITGNLPARLNVILTKMFKYYNSITHHMGFLAVVIMKCRRIA